VKAPDFLKAAGLALGILVVNVMLSVVVMVVYSYAVNPGHDETYYTLAAQRIAPWCSVVFGGPLFFLACRWAARTPGRNPLHFALATFGAYAAIDLSIVAAEGALATMAGIVTLSTVTKLAGAVMGARAAAK
jgi:hypothetical protein